MDDDGETRGKEFTPPSIKCPILNATNYTVWSMRMKVLLKIYKVWETIEPGAEDQDKNNIAIGLLFQSIPESLILQIGEQETSKGIWDAIKARNLGADRVKEARLQTLMIEFDRINMKDSDTIDSFAGKLSEIASKSAALGTTIEESKLVKKFLSSLPMQKYIQITASLEQVLDLKTVGFEDVIGRLKAYEERILAVENNGDSQGKLLYSNAYQQNNSTRGRGRGRGGRGNRGRGRGNFNSQERTTQPDQSQDKEKKDRSKLVCFRCDKAGHFASVCPERLQKIQEANKVETEDADPALYMHELVFLNEENLVPKKYEIKKGEEDLWYLDNGASNHMTGNVTYFSELNRNIKGKVKFGDDSHVNIEGKGSILFQSKTGEQKLVTNIYYIPDLKSNILSLGQATEVGCDVRMKLDYLTVHDPRGRLLVKVTRSPNRLYKIKLQTGKPLCLSSRLEDETWKWHARLGHISFKTIRLMSQQEMVQGLPMIEDETRFCESCLVGKQTRQSFPKAATFRAKKPLELLHADLCGPITPPTIANNRYIFVIIDDFSRYMWSILMKEKSDAFSRFKAFKEQVERDLEKKIMTLRTDRGGEFTSTEFHDYCNINGIKRHLTAPYTPQQNGVVERRNRTLMEMTRSTLKAMKVPNYLWGEAVRHSTYIINRVPTRALENMTPYECLRKKKPNLSHLRVFGCLAYAKIDSAMLKKLDDRSLALVNFGTEPGSKAYRLYNPTTRRIVVSRDVVFNEKNGWDWNKTAEKSQEPGMFQMKWGEIIDAGQGPVVVNNDNNNIDDHHDNINEEDQHEADDGNDHDPQPQIQQPVRQSSRQSNRPRYLDDYVLQAELAIERLLLSINDEPRNYLEAKKSSKWRGACGEEIVSINKNETWILVDKPSGAKVIGLKWIFKIKRNADGTIKKFKARLVAKGYVQESGIDYDEVFAPVARLETIRLLSALAASHGWQIHHLDVKTAFLYGELKEDVYVEQPEGYEVKGKEHKVYKLSKALYGLKQAPRAWNTKLDRVLKEMKFTRCTKENAVYRKEDKQTILIIAIYVDDLFITGNSLDVISEFKRGMSSKFEMSDLGKLTYYLGIEVHQGDDGIELRQEAYAKKVLKEVGLDTCNPTKIPMEFGLKVSKAEKEEEIDATAYRRNVGCLRYLLHTRPDLAFSVGVASRYMQRPRKSHGDIMKQIMRYLQGSSTFGLKYRREGTKKLTGYSDSSHNIDQDDGRSTTGHMFYFGTSPITWCSQKQNTVALSSCEAEFMAATEAARQAIWLQELLSEITGWKSERVTIKIDSKSAIELTKNPVFHGKSKHIHKRYHFIRECIERELVDVEHIPGTSQKADILTKALARVKFVEMRNLIGVQDLSKTNAKLKRETVE